MTAPVLMIQGTASSAGKSTLVAGLCRLFANRGLRVAPFKAQNMSNNAAVCPGGGEIGRAQFTQAVAARIEPSVDHNPILLKPQADQAAQLIVRGELQGVQTAADYFGARRAHLWPVVADALDRLRETCDLVIAEGAGSPAEINLRDRDIVNMRVALHARAEVLLVADIDRGGAFAALLGTWSWLEPHEQALVRGFVLNRFRGDAALLAPGPALLAARTGIAVLGVVPYVPDLGLPEEDAATLDGLDARASGAVLEIAIVRLPHVANFDEFGPLMAEPGVAVRFVASPAELRAPDLVILPGTKATIPDLLWLHARGLAARIQWLAARGTPVLGICGGYQMLGQSVADPWLIESDATTAHGLGLLPLVTELGTDKRLTATTGTGRPDAHGLWVAWRGVAVAGYEIHVGRSAGDASRPLFDLRDGPDGAISEDGIVAGTYIHGVLEQVAPRHALLESLAAARGLRWAPTDAAPEDPFDRLAAIVEGTLRLDTLEVARL